MDRYLESGFHRRGIQRLIEPVAVATDAAVAGLIFVVIKHARAARTQCAIVIRLDRPGYQHTVIVRVRTLLNPLADQWLIPQ